MGGWYNKESVGVNTFAGFDFGVLSNYNLSIKIDADAECVDAVKSYIICIVVRYIVAETERRGRGAADW